MKSLHPSLVHTCVTRRDKREVEEEEDWDGLAGEAEWREVVWAFLSITFLKYL